MSKFRKYNVNESYFETWSHNMAYILGFITADGNVNKYTLAIELAVKDKEILEFIKSEIISDGEIKSTFKKGKEYCRLRINSKILVASLQKFNIIPNKTFTIRLDFNIPSEYIGDYLRGLFDGDGTVQCRRNRIESSISSYTKEFLNDIKNIILIGKIRQRSKVNKKRIKRYWYSLDFYTKPTLKFRDLIYSSGGFALQRKKDKFYSEFYKRSPRYWTEEQIQYLKENFKPDIDGLLNQLAKSIGKSRSAVSKKIWELHLRQIATSS